MRIQVDISFFIQEIFSQFLDVLISLFEHLDNIIIFKASDWGAGDFSVSLLDFNIGLLVTAIVVGAFIRVNKADTFYSNRKD